VPPTRSALPTPAERAAELEALEGTVRRQIRWVYARAVVLCLLSMLLALAAIGWSVHSTDEGSAQIAFWGGLLIGNVGIMWTLLATYNRAIEEGWV
jgi:hypothetical protein